MVGLRPTRAVDRETTDLRRLAEAQRLREIVEELVAEIAGRTTLNHAAVRASLGRSYLVDLFECSGKRRCLLGVLGKLRERARLAVYGEYSYRSARAQVRLQLFDLESGRLLAETDLAIRAREVDDPERWREGIAELVATVPGGAAPPPEETLDPEEGAAGAGAGGATPAGDGSAVGDGVATGDGSAASGDAAPTDSSALDALDAIDPVAGGAKERGAEGPQIRRLRVSLASELRSYPFDRAGLARDEQLLVEGMLDLDVRVSGGASFLFRPRALVDAFDDELQRFEPLEGYFQYAAASWDLRLGQFVDSWGIADAFNPLDVLNRRDYGVDLVDPPALGELGLYARYQFTGGETIGEPSVAVYLMPLWRATPLPTARNRFSLEGAGADLVDQTGVDGVVDGAFAALRLEHTVTTDALNADFQYLAARGPARFPAVALSPRADGGVDLVATTYGAYLAGGGFRMVPNASGWSKFTFKSEVGYSIPYALVDSVEPLPDRYLQFAAGVDRQFDGLFGDLDTLTLTLEYVGEALADDLLAELRPFDRDVAARVLWEAKDFARAAIEARLLVDVVSGEMLGELSLTRQLRFLHDDLRLELVAQGIRPDPAEEGLFALFPDNSNLRVRLGFDF